MSDRRMAENEVVFREYNEKVQQGIENLKKIAAAEGQTDQLGDLDMELEFFCECSDENCRRRITMKPSLYTKIHKKRDHFIIIPAHEAKIIEHVVLAKSDYSIVRKYITPPETAGKLHPTSMNNS